MLPISKILPPDRFVLRGVTFLKAIEVTDQEVLSSLKRDLIDQRVHRVADARFGELQKRSCARCSGGRSCA